MINIGAQIGYLGDLATNTEFIHRLKTNPSEIALQFGLIANGQTAHIFENSDSIVHIVIPALNNIFLSDEFMGNIKAGKGSNTISTIGTAGCTASCLSSHVTTLCSVSCISTIGCASSA